MFFATKSQYGREDIKGLMKTNEEEESLIQSSVLRDPVLPQSLRRRRTRHRRCSAIFLVVKDLLLLCLAIPTAITLILQNGVIHHQPSLQLDPGHQHLPNSCDCGRSTIEAVALGCKYDSLAAAWLPEHCRDDELTAEFERSGDGPNGTWIYWADTKHTQELTLDEIAAMADSPDARFHMSNHWHIIHCIFYWRKEHRFRFNNKMVEPRSDNEGHIKHCGNIFLHSAYGTIAGVPLNTDHGHNTN